VQKLLVALLVLSLPFLLFFRRPCPEIKAHSAIQNHATQNKAAKESVNPTLRARLSLDALK